LTQQRGEELAGGMPSEVADSSTVEAVGGMRDDLVGGRPDGGVRRRHQSDPGSRVKRGRRGALVVYFDCGWTATGRAAG
jgi:hypothetical protein